MARTLKLELQQAARVAGIRLAPAERRAVDCGIPSRPVLRVDEAAALLQISENQVRALAECGQLLAVNVGLGRERVHLRIATASVRRLIEGA